MDLIGELLQSFGSLFENNKKLLILLIKNIRENGFVLLPSVIMVPKSDNILF